jgi:hypothetical protein
MGEGSRAGAADSEQDSMSVSTRFASQAASLQYLGPITPTSENKATLRLSARLLFSQALFRRRVIRGCSPQAYFCTACRGGDTFFLSLQCRKWSGLLSSTLNPPKFHAHRGIFNCLSTTSVPSTFVQIITRSRTWYMPLSSYHTYKAWTPFLGRPTFSSCCIRT